MLSELQLGEFIYEQPAVGDIEYTFKHALTHDVAYHSMLNERRRLLHERIGAALESIYADNLRDHIVELARLDSPVPLNRTNFAKIVRTFALDSLCREARQCPLGGFGVRFPRS